MAYPCKITFISHRVLSVWVCAALASLAMVSCSRDVERDPSAWQLPEDLLPDASLDLTVGLDEGQALDVKHDLSDGLPSVHDAEQDAEPDLEFVAPRWEQVRMKNDLTAQSHQVVPGPYRLLWSIPLGQFNRRRCSGGSHEMTLWGDLLWVRYYDSEQDLTKLRAVEAATGRVLRELDAPETLSAPLVRADGQWFGTSLFDRPYSLKDVEGASLSFPFEGEPNILIEGAPEAFIDPRGFNPHTPLVARRDRTLLQSLSQHIYREEDQSLESFYLMMRSRFEGEVEQVASRYDAFALTRDETLLTFESSKLLRASAKAPGPSWSYEPGEGYNLTPVLLDLDERLVVVVQREEISQTWSTQKPEPGCEVRVLNASSGELVASHPVHSTLLQRRSEQGEPGWRALWCGSLEFPNSADPFVLEGKQAVWTVTGNKQPLYEHDLKVERIDVSMGTEAQEHIVPLPEYVHFRDLMSHPGLLRGVGNGLLGLFTKGIAFEGERPSREAQLSYVDPQGELTELYTFANQQPDRVEVDVHPGEVYYSWSGCRTPPLLDEQGRIFVVLQEEGWDRLGGSYYDEGYEGIRPYQAKLFALEPVR